MSPVKPIPDNYGTVTPYLIIKDAAKAVEFYKKVFGAEEVFRMPMPDGSIMHAEIRVGNSRLMMTDEGCALGAKSPMALGGAPVSFYLYVADADATYNLALKEGGTVIRAIEDRFYGDRVGMIRDPFGHVWSVATHIEDVPKDELMRRAQDMQKKMGNEGEKK
ncbi:MAG: VOC family protein [Alphaproteobacteria bacterium]|nr:VOC family protein [Alphaproteobacteria bacterium]